ncbi:class V lanthionine synthetase subunit LxmK [Amycolatopsis sp. NPDC059021]|uniref:class V lanthionine synthetase subunit LxmK n=1 Tax=Amycolatopsis sp. NPDC059021 TaxID=3346704 RepID=UPI00366B4D55
MPAVRDRRRVDAVLDRFGLGGLDWATAAATGGRNDNWLGTTGTGRRVFVKTIVGSRAVVAHGLRRTEAFYRAHAGSGAQDTLRTTTLIGQDDQAAVQIFDLLDGARDGRETAKDGAFDSTLAAQAGEAVGALHNVSPASLHAVEQALPPLPDENPLAGLTMEMFYAASAAELQVWRLLQQDGLIRDALTQLDRDAAEVPPVPVHGDLRLDQFLIAGGRLYLADWEMFQLGDPASDLGGFVGEWLHHAVTRFLGERMKRGTAPAPTIALSPTWRPWRQTRPLAEAFWLAYRTARPDPSCGLASRVTRFAAWHLLLRVVTDARFRARLDGSGHTLIRLAKMIMLNPDRFATVLGLGDR